LPRLKAAANKFAGKHDFAGFAANCGKPIENTVRTIHSVKVRKRGQCVTIDFKGDGFLYKMVRLIVGSIVDCALGRMSIEEISRQLGSRGSFKRLAAPANGLYLVRVRY
jgi:tRNA pseudouridine38-40 synthase